MPESPHHAPFVVLYEELRRLYPTTRNALVLKDTHDQLTHVAHGWYMRTLRSCDGVMLMRRSGFAEEAWPLRRAAIEHVLALRWIASVGNDAKDVIIRSHARSARQRQDAQANAEWSSATWEVWEQIARDALTATGNESESNMLRNHSLRARKYGHPSDLAAWLIETSNTHPGWSTVTPYWDRATQTPRVTPNFDHRRLDAAWCASSLLRGLDALNAMMETSIWTDELAGLGERYQTLEAAIPRTPEST